MNDAFIQSGMDMVNTMIEEFAKYLPEIHPSLTLKDFGFLVYEVDPDRPSGIRSEQAAGLPAD